MIVKWENWNRIIWLMFKNSETLSLIFYGSSGQDDRRVPRSVIKGTRTNRGLLNQIHIFVFTMSSLSGEFLANLISLQPRDFQVPQYLAESDFQHELTAHVWFKNEQ